MIIIIIIVIRIIIVISARGEGIAFGSVCFASGLYWRSLARGKASWRSEPILGPSRLVWSSTIRCGRTRTRHTMPLQAQAGDPHGTGSQAHRPQEKTLCWRDPRKATTGFRRPPDIRRPEDNSQQLSTTLSKTRRQPLYLWPTHASLIPCSHSLIGQRGNALCPYLEPSQNEMLVPIFGAKPERNACAHIWSEARVQCLCQYLG